MVGFMNKEALEKTEEIGKVTFFSRTKTGYGQKERSREIS
jgi:phosphoribosyl-AMP cyclohydrolase